MYGPTYSRYDDHNAVSRDLTTNQPNPYMEDQRYALLRRIDEMLEENKKLARQLRRNTILYFVLISLVLLATATITFY